MFESKIEWCDDTVNAWIGCTKVSPGCAFCYADNLDSRKIFGGQRNWGPNAPRLNRVDAACRELRRSASRAERDGGVRYVFLSSLCDLFEDRDDVAPWRASVWETLCEINKNAVRLVALMLTKRPDVMLRWQREVVPEGLPAWAWVGTSVEDQTRAEERVPLLLQVQTAGVRFLSMEPLLGLVDLTGLKCGADFDGEGPPYYNALRGASYWADGDHGINGPSLGWIIVGGESGPKARPMHPAWARSLRDQCETSGVAFTFKQWGEWAPLNAGPGADLDWAVAGPTAAEGGSLAAGFFDYNDRWHEGGGNPFRQSMVRVGKKGAGRLLDTVVHSSRPVLTFGPEAPNEAPLG